MSAILCRGNARHSLLAIVLTQCILNLKITCRPPLRHVIADIDYGEDRLAFFCAITLTITLFLSMVAGYSQDYMRGGGDDGDRVEIIAEETAGILMLLANALPILLFLTNAISECRARKSQKGAAKPRQVAVTPVGGKEKSGAKNTSSESSSTKQALRDWN